jgi:AraC-like DNA-binding protein
MEYITVKEAAEKWGVSIRRIQYLCKHDLIPNTVRFAKVWGIPKESKKPIDGRYKVHEKKHKHIEQFFEAASVNNDMFRKIIEFFIYPIQVFKADGASVMINDAFVNVFKIKDRNSFIDNFNILTNPNIEKWGIKNHLLKAFNGEATQTVEISVPVGDLINKYSTQELGYEKIYQNITAFPIKDKNNKLEYVVSIFITSRHYRDREEIMKAKDYIDNHYLEKFRIDKVSSTVNLSKYYFIRLFKKHIGNTPYAYYQDLKINRLKERLCDVNISISQAFADCGVDYNGNFVKAFKQKVGMTPSQYRTSIIKK